MWTMIHSLDSVVTVLAPAFTQPSFATNCNLLLAWVMCLGKHTLLRVADNTRPDQPPDRSQRHDFNTVYNFFERSSWKPKDLAYRIALLILTRLPFVGPITLLVDDTLAHKRGKCVWGMGWFRDAVASTQKRVATATGHNWVVLAVAFCVPGTTFVILALPLLARLHQPGKGQPSCAQLAREMLAEVMKWFPSHTFNLVGDGAYACKEMLGDWPKERVNFTGRLRGDAALYDPKVAEQPKSKPGKKTRAKGQDCPARAMLPRRPTPTRARKGRGCGKR